MRILFPARTSPRKFYPQFCSRQEHSSSLCSVFFKGYFISIALTGTKLFLNPLLPSLHATKSSKALEILLVKVQRVARVAQHIQSTALVVHGDGAERLEDQGFVLFRVH